jgi:hypothetical protein
MNLIYDRVLVPKRIFICVQPLSPRPRELLAELDSKPSLNEVGRSATIRPLAWAHHRRESPSEFAKKFILLVSTRVSSLTVHTATSCMYRCPILMKADGTPEMFNSAQTTERHEITNGVALKRTQKNPRSALQEGQGEL